MKEGKSATEAPSPVSRPMTEAGPYSIHITPESATLFAALDLEAKGFSLDAADVEWLLNGEAVATPRQEHFDIPELNVLRGDTVQARAVVNGREILSNVVEVGNVPPEITDISLVSRSSESDYTIGLEVAAKDAEGDPVTLEYRWVVNGSPAGEEKFLETEIRRGDSFTATVVPFDGRDRGQPASMTRTITNLPPVFTMHHDYAFDGKIYTYAVKAWDPDGDSLTFSLSSGPEGMTVDPSTGMVRWEVPPDYIGTASFAVRASDGQGGDVDMPLTFTLAEEKEEKQD